MESSRRAVHGSRVLLFPDVSCSTKMPRDIFISYTTDDKAIADDLCKSLESAGLTCWIAPRNIEPGSNWTLGIMTAILECQIMLLIYSAKSNQSNHVVRQILHAIENRRPVLPFRIEESIPTGGLAYCLGGVQWFDATTPPLGRHIASLVVQMRRLLQPQKEVHAWPPSPSADATGSIELGRRPPEIHFECNQCGQRLVADAVAAVRSANCPACGKALVVTRPDAIPTGQPLRAAGEAVPPNC